MLFVLNKDKMISYVIALSTAAVLICFSAISTNQSEIVNVSSNKTYAQNIIHGE